MLTMKAKETESATSAPPLPPLLGPSRLRQVAAALLDSVGGRLTPSSPSLCCPQCQWIPIVPVTLPCGHTLCKPCLTSPSSPPLSSCPQCSHPLPPVLPETNVLLKAAVEKWWAPEVEAAHIKEQGDSYLKNNLLHRALDKYNAALEIVPEGHLLLEARSTVLQRLNKCEDSLLDAQQLTRLRPLWPNGYYRKGLILATLGLYEDALLSFSICVALEKNSGKVKQEFIKTLHRFLSPAAPCKTIFGSRRSPLTSWWPNCTSLPKTEDDGIMESFNKTGITSFPTLESKKMHSLLDRIFEEIEKTKKNATAGRAVLLRREAIDVEDFECVLCCRTLWSPVTTPCGHTYCSMCLDRCLDYSPNCPLCMTSLSQYLVSSDSEKTVTEFLESALALALPHEFTGRLMSHRQEVAVLVEAPDVPVFVCTTAFPSVPCPLFVFEPRYRLMVRRAIESKGCFGMAACVPLWNGIKGFAEYGTLLEIKDIVMRSDGCSILSNVGCRRFRVISRGERDGYDTAQVQYLRDEPISQQSLPELTSLHDAVRERGLKWFSSMSQDMQTTIVRTFGTMPQLESNWSELDDGPAWAWWLVAILPLGQQLQIGILGTTCLEKRLRAIDKTLRHFEEGPRRIEAVSTSRDCSIKRLT